MGPIKKNLSVWGDKGSRLIDDVLFDSGASHTVIREDIAKDICSVARYPADQLENNRLTLADGHTLQVVGTCSIQTSVEGRPVEDSAKVVEVVQPKTQPELIIGQNTLQRYEIQLRHNEPARGGDRLIVPKPRKAVLSSTENPGTS